MSEQLLLEQMSKKGIIKYGEFTSNHGGISNVCINIKELNNYHNILSLACVLLYEKFKIFFFNANICGVPYGGITIATLVSNLCKTGLILHELNKIVNGSKEKEIVIIDDIVTTDINVLQSCEILEANGYKIRCIISIIYEGYVGDKKNIIGKYPYKYLFSLDDILSNSYNYKSEHDLNVNNLSSNYFQYHNHKLLQLKKQKKTSIILAYDHGSYDELIKLIDKIHPYIVGIKIHNEILELSYSENLLLYMKAKKLNIFLWEDRKFNDIGNTITNQIMYYESIRDYISIVPISGESSLFNIQNTKLGFFILSELTTYDNILNSLNTQQIIDITIRNKAAGIICQTPENLPPWMISIMSGIHISQSNDRINQQWRDPRNIKYKPTFYVVGRAITNTDDPIEELKKYVKICL